MLNAFPVHSTKMNSLALNRTWARSAHALGPPADQTPSPDSRRTPARNRVPRVGPAAERRFVHRAHPLLTVAGSGEHSLRPQLGLLQHERVVEHHERLRGDVRHRPPADGRERRRVVERGEHRVEEVPPDGKVDAAPAVAVERAARRPAAADLVLGQVRQHARPFQLAIEPPGDGQDRVANRLGLEPADVLPVQELVLRDRR